MTVRRIRNLVLGCTLLGGLVLAPLTASGVLTTTPAGAASGSHGIIPGGAVANAPITRAVIAASGTYLFTVTFSGSSTVIGAFTISPNGTLSGNLSSATCSGVWTTTGNYISIEFSGSIAPSGCFSPAQDFVMSGHLSKRGIKSGTFLDWPEDANGNPTGPAGPHGTWSAVKGP